MCHRTARPLKEALPVKLLANLSVQPSLIPLLLSRSAVLESCLSGKTMPPETAKLQVKSYFSQLFGGTAPEADQALLMSHTEYGQPEYF